MPEQFGRVTNHVIHKSESHKLTQSFFVPHDDADDVHVGMPVKLSPADDFTVQPLALGDNRNLAIGIALHDTDIAGAAAGSTPSNSVLTTYGDLKVTVAMKAYAIIIGTAIAFDTPNGGAIVPGPVKYLGYDTGTDRFPQAGVNQFMNCAADDAAMIGWALEAIAVDEFGQIALIN